MVAVFFALSMIHKEDDNVALGPSSSAVFKKKTKHPQYNTIQVVERTIVGDISI